MCILLNFFYTRTAVQAHIFPPVIDKCQLQSLLLDGPQGRNKAVYDSVYSSREELRKQHTAIYNFTA